MVQSSAKSKRAVDAFQAFDNGDVVPVGSYTTSYAGGSVTATMADEFCKMNGVEKGDELDYWFHYKTGALIILPKDRK